MSVVLGLHYGHGGSVCVVKNGKLIGAIASERLVGQKFSHGVYDSDIDYLLGNLGMNLEDVDYVGLSDWNKQYAWNDIKVRWTNQSDSQRYRTCNCNDRDEIQCLWNEIYDNTCLELDIRIRDRQFPGFYIGHQLAHAASAFFTSPFEEAYCFTMDASGAKHKNNSLVSHGKGNKLTSLYCPGLMIGVAYGFFTEFLGLGSQIFKAGSTMALAGYGEVLKRVQDNLAAYVNGCFFPDHKDYHQWYLNLWPDLSGSTGYFNREQSTSKIAMNVAATIQLIFQEAILSCVKSIDSGSVKNLCLSGGSMLNCTANSLLLKESQFDNIHLFPACGDEGGSIGAALYVAHHVLEEPRAKYKDHEICYLGPERPVGIEPDYAYLAKKLTEGKIIAWCNGRSECGPRALGHRSLLADPRAIRSRERLNFEIKHREWFRPLAPIVMEEWAQEWFDFPTKSPFMLFTMPIKHPDAIPAVNHIDGTSRIQTVTEESNPGCYRLLDEFRLRTGVPMLVNTSLNQNGQPIIETTDLAMAFFDLGLVDILALDGQVFER